MYRSSYKGRYRSNCLAVAGLKIDRLDPKMSDFFSQIHGKKELDDRLKVCQSSHDAIELAQECGVNLSEDDLQRAAMVAEAIPGFSFEKLWFRGLGLIS